MNITEREKKWLRVRWEFVRRDPAYKMAWQQRKDLECGAMRIDDKEDDEERTMAADRLFHAIAVGFEEFGLSFWLDPTLEFDEILNNQALLYSLMSRKCSSVLVDLPDPDSEQFSTTMSIHIDFSRVNSRDELKKYVCALIDDQFKNQAIGRKKQKRDVDYDNILLAGRLRENGMTYKAIALELFPSDVDIKTAIKKAQQHYARYKEFVNGQHKDLAFP